MRFSDKVCLVTGGGSGIGKATCVRLASEGGRVLVVDLKEDAARQSVETIRRRGGQAEAAGADVSDAAHVQAHHSLAFLENGSAGLGRDSVTHRR